MILSKFFWGHPLLPAKYQNFFFNEKMTQHDTAQGVSSKTRHDTTFGVFLAIRSDTTRRPNLQTRRTLFIWATWGFCGQIEVHMDHMQVPMGHMGVHMGQLGVSIGYKGGHMGYMGVHLG